LESGKERRYNGIPEKHGLDFEIFIQAKLLLTAMSVSQHAWRKIHREI
jgi:hypothetical protein